MTTAVAVRESRQTAVAVPVFNREQVQLLKRTIAKGATDDELALFVSVCKARRLNPFTKQIYAIKRWNSRERRDEMQIQTSVDGLRLIAQRSGEYGGQLPPEWASLHVVDNKPSIVWWDVWPFPEAPFAARVSVLRKGMAQPITAVARWSSYAQKTKEGEVTAMWRNMPDLMLAKVAESLAIRKAFPEECGGIYTAEEMAQAGDGEVVAEAPAGEAPAPAEDEAPPVRVTELSEACALPLPFKKSAAFGKPLGEMPSEGLRTIASWIEEKRAEHGNKYFYIDVTDAIGLILADRERAQLSFLADEAAAKAEQSKVESDYAGAPLAMGGQNAPATGHSGPPDPTSRFARTKHINELVKDPRCSHLRDTTRAVLLNDPTDHELATMESTLESLVDTNAIRQGH